MTKAPRKSKTFDLDREFSVILERIHGDITILAEGQKALDEKFTNKFNILFEEFGRQKESIFRLTADVALLKEDVAILKADVAILKKDVLELKTDMKAVKADIAEIKIILRSHDNRIAALETLK